MHTHHQYNITVFLFINQIRKYFMESGAMTFIKPPFSHSFCSIQDMHGTRGWR